MIGHAASLNFDLLTPEPNEFMFIPRCQNVRWKSTLQTLHHMVGWARFNSTQFRSFRRQCFYRSDDPTNSVKAL